MICSSHHKEHFICMSVEFPSLWAVKNYRIPAKCKKDLCSKVQKGSLRSSRKVTPMYNSAEPHIMQVLITHKNKLLWLLLAAAKTQAYTCGVTYKELPLWQKYRQAYRQKRRQHKLLKDGSNLHIWFVYLGKV